MLFPSGDKNWEEVVELFDEEERRSAWVVAPIAFHFFFDRLILDVYPRVRGSELVDILDERINPDYAIIHKGRVERLEPGFLDFLMERYHPFFANEVFEVFSKEERKGEFEDSHIQPLVHEHKKFR